MQKLYYMPNTEGAKITTQYCLSLNTENVIFFGKHVYIIKNIYIQVKHTELSIQLYES